MLDGLELGGLSDPQDGDSPGTNEREAELGSNGWLRESLRQSNAESVDRLLFRAPPHNFDVRKLGRHHVEEVALPALRLEQRKAALGKRDRKRDSRRASARADVDDRTFCSAQQRSGAESVFKKNAAGFLEGG